MTRMVDFSLSGKVAIVTGAGTGIGRGVTLALAEAGAAVVAAGRTPAPLDAVAGDVHAAGGAALAVPTDVTDRGAIGRLVDAAVARFGRVDILVNNAGGGGGQGHTFRRAPVMEISGQEIDDCFALNFKAAVLCSQAVHPVMIAAGGGSIVHMASMAGRDYDHPMPGSGIYGAAKAALVNMSKTMATEWAPDVRVNCVSPGMIAIDSPRVTAIRSPERLKSMTATIAMGRPGDPVDVAAAVVYLASDAAQWVTGTVIDIHGGLKSSWLPAPVVRA